MKTALVLTTLLAVFSSMTIAEETRTVSFSADINVARCEGAEPFRRCSISASIPNNVTLVLQKQEYGGTVQNYFAGDYITMQSVDGFRFIGIVSVSLLEDTSTQPATSQYQLSVEIFDNGGPAARMWTTVSDLNQLNRFSLQGNSKKIADVEYFPSFTIGASQSSPRPIPVQNTSPNNWSVELGTGHSL